jgi:hypothetical protein
MGYRLHHATTYKVEYGQGFFNHSGAELEELLQAIFPSFYTNDESTHWEIQKDELKAFIDYGEDGTIPNYFNVYLSENQYDEYTYDNFEEQLMELEKVTDYSLPEIVKIFRLWYEESEQELDYVILEWY